MGVKCCSCNRDYDDVITIESKNQRLNLQSMTIVEFERRVKKYAHIKNRGKISIEQLQEAFKDTQIFTNLKHPSSLAYKLITSPFFTQFTLTHYQSQVIDFQEEEKTIDHIRTNKSRSNRTTEQERPSVERVSFQMGDTFAGHDEEQKTEKGGPPTFGDSNAEQFLSARSQASSGWISIDALLLKGILACKGSNLEKAKCFYMIVQPSFEKSISTNDSDLRKVIHFLVGMATVIEEMTLDMLGADSVYFNYSKYDQKIKRHQRTFDEVYEYFIDDLFGEFSNRISREGFIRNLSQQGWKYFNLYSLNSIFVSKFNELSEEEKGGMSLVEYGGGSNYKRQVF